MVKLYYNSQQHGDVSNDDDTATFIEVNSDNQIKFLNHDGKQKIRYIANLYKNKQAKLNGEKAYCNLVNCVDVSDDDLLNHSIFSLIENQLKQAFSDLKVDNIDDISNTSADKSSNEGNT